MRLYANGKIYSQHIRPQSLLKLSRILCAHSAYNFPRDPFDLYHLKSQRSLDTQSIIFILSVVVRRRRHLAFPLGSESSSDGANAMPILVRLIVQFSSLPFFFPLFISSTYSSSSSTHLNVTSRSARFHLSFVRSMFFFLMNANFLLFQETQTGTSDVTFFSFPASDVCCIMLRLHLYSQMMIEMLSIKIFSSSFCCEVFMFFDVI